MIGYATSRVAMNRGPHRPSLPSMSEPSVRRLGIGGGAGGDRPIRAQLVVALMAALVLIAVPLYLWRRPGAAPITAPSASAGVPLSLPLPDAGAVPAAAASDAGAPTPRVVLARPQRVKCASSSAARGHEGKLCEALPIFDEALAKAIRENADCAPKTGKQGSLNYVLSVDFRLQKVRVYPGRSGEWRGPLAKRAAECVQRALPAPQWRSIRHQYGYYLIAILATYPVPAATFDPSAPPRFD